jgi:hypothetical protein
MYSVAIHDVKPLALRAVGMDNDAPVRKNAVNIQNEQCKT